MKILILGAGYGTRLAKDLEKTDEYTHLRGVPKPLLPIAGKPLISHWMDIINSCPYTTGTDVYIVVNDLNHQLFKTWSDQFPKQVHLVSDGTTHNDNRLGAVGCMELAIKHFNINDDVIVIGGDTLFYEDFLLTNVIDRFNSTSCSKKGGAVVVCYQCDDSATSKVGILEVDDDGCVTSFLEKPSPDSTTSRNACPCFYVFSSGSIPLMNQFLIDNKDEPLVKKDAPGNYIRYLSSRRNIYIFGISGRFDVGNLPSYIICNEKYKIIKHN